MKRAFAIGALFGLVLALSPAVEARPPGELPLFLRINGEPTRTFLADGGQLGLYGSAATCLTGADATAQAGVILKMTPSAKVHLCMRSTDAGCTTSVGDVNYGDPIAADTPHYVIVKDSTPAICMIPATGSANVPIFRME